MNYVFVFLGEFGYELFNWQGLVRKFKTTCSPEDKIIIGGRTGMDIWYPYADIFIDISADPFYKASRADGYFAYDINTPYRTDSQDAIKASVQAYIAEKLKSFNLERPEFIFSSDLNLINGVHFGMWEKFFNIYGGEGHKQNFYAKNDYDSAELKNDLETRLQINLSEPYILIQGRKRDIVIRSKHVVPTELLVEKLAEKIPVVVLNFNTGRAWDSRSEIAGGKNCRVLKTFSAHEQAILIKHAADCVFTTENDFGSHIYVPPFMGRDVLAIAGADVYKIGTTPIDFWNGEIFKFGGQILPFVSEEIFASDATLNGFCEIILKRISANRFFAAVENIHQEKILQRVGISDYDTNDPRSRSTLIIDCLGKLIRGGKISYPFVLADICGGDAIVGTKIKEHFMLSEVIVQDCFKGKFSTHTQAHERGVKLYGGWLQHLVEGDLTNKIDVVLMLNTFRGWHSAKLRPHEQDIPMKTLLWFERNSKFFIVTATVDQIKFLEQRGLTIVLLGKGEDDSYMVCASKNF